MQVFPYCEVMTRDYRSRPEPVVGALEKRVISQQAPQTVNRESNAQNC